MHNADVSLLSVLTIWWVLLCHYAWSNK